MILKLNKYLKELGIDEHNWLFDKETQEIDDRYKPDEEGFIDAEHFSLDYSLSLYIYSQLCYFRDHCLVGHPAYMTFEQWKDIIDKMIEAFKLQILEDNTWDRFQYPNEAEKVKASKNRQKKINYGMRLFIKYYNHLWY